jgi:hypothetical protein
MSETATADADVAAALGVGEPAPDAPDSAADQQTEDQQDRAQVADETPFEELPDAWQDEIRRLRRENAQQRVTRRDAARQQGSGDEQDKAPTAQAIRAAEERGRSAARLENGVRLAGAEVRAALAGAFTEEQVTDIVDELNLSRYVTDDGDVDRESVKHLRDKLVSSLGKKPAVRPGHGQRQTAPTKKSNAEQFGDWLNGQ